MSARRAKSGTRALERLLPMIIRDPAFPLAPCDRSRATARLCYLPDSEMRRLARAFRGERKKNVDVLAFPEEGHFPHPDLKGKFVLGDIYLRDGLRAKPFPLRAFFLLHGLLHLLGYTHDGKRDTILMESCEKLLFRKFFPSIPHPWPRATTATTRRARGRASKKRS